ncbi:MAG: hypothetical protein KKD17_02600 [Nanoarchaeota archaeon]|nr:hypothetical protein [Nanoarchaeota archaeon]
MRISAGFWLGVGFAVLAYATCLKSDDSQKEAGAGNVQAHNVYDDQGQEYRVVDGGLREPANTILGADNPLCVERHHPSGSIRACAYENNTRLRVEFYDPGGELQRQATIDALMTDDSVQEYVKQYIKDSSLLRNAGLMH